MCARSRDRTGTSFYGHWILSPARLPIPPFGPTDIPGPVQVTGDAKVDIFTELSKTLRLFNGFEISVGVHFQLSGRGVISHNPSGRMILKRGNGTVVSHRSLNGCCYGTGFLGAERQNHHLLCTVYGRDTHGHRLLGNLVDVIVEETGIHQKRVLGKRDHTGAGLQGGERFVERDMSVLAYAAEEEIEPAGRSDSLFIIITLLLQVLGVAVEDMDILRRLVDLVEKVFVHE